MFALGAALFPLMGSASAQVPLARTGSGNAGPGTAVPNVLSVEPLLHYTPPLANGTIRTPYWKKHLPDNAGTFQFVIKTERPVTANGARIWYHFDGDAELGVHYQIVSPNPVAISPGDDQAVIEVELLASGSYYRERHMELVLDSTYGSITLDPFYKYAQLWVRPSVDPPTISFASTLNTVAPGSLVNVPVTLSHPSLEPVSLHYTVSSDSTLTDYAFAPSGTVIVPPGDTSATLRLLCLPSATPGQTLTLALYHERNGVRFTIPALDPAETTNPDLYAQDVHLDENLWTFSDGGVQWFEHDDLRNPAPHGPAMPGVPTDHLTGGSYWAPGQENEMLVDLIPQANVAPLTDPFSGAPLKAYAISDAASLVPPYLRKSFNASFCGSNTQLYDLPEYMRISYYVRMPEGPDAFRAVPFFRAGVRVRTQDINHGVTFRIGSTGVDAHGNPVQVWQTSLGPIGEWDRSQVYNTNTRFGIVEDDFGVRVWFAHHLDPSVGYVHPTQGDTRFETPGVDRGNPIEYPTWVGPGDGSLALMGLGSVDDAVGLGNLAYGFMWEVSHAPDVYTGALRPYFPKPGSWWEPIGNAVLDDDIRLKFVVQ
ncbi:MAG: hypothetical protein R3F17_13050 [Planctomycetota bacterium]